jgi:hypothetical protein
VYIVPNHSELPPLQDVASGYSLPLGEASGLIAAGLLMPASPLILMNLTAAYRLSGAAT